MKNSTVLSDRQHGFTLIEMIVVIVITGIIGGMVAMFIRAPVEGYVDSARRAEMTDVADIVVRRISRDLRLALPNSVRVSGDGLFVEFIPTTGGGRYRSAAATAASAVCGSSAAAVLNFGVADTCFEVLGTMPTAAIGDQVVFYNLGIPGADAYAGNTGATHNRRGITAVAANSLVIASANQFPLDACQVNAATGANTLCRFYLVNTPVSYVCAPAVGGVGGTLTRYSGYPIQAVQPTTVAALLALGGVQQALIATNVGAQAGGGCNFSYNASLVAQRLSVVTMALTITQPSGVASFESVTLFSATQISNAP